MQQPQQLQNSHLPAAHMSPSPSLPKEREPAVEAPPKQVALAMDRLAHASRLIADIRISGDRLLEAIFFTDQPTKPLQLIIKEDGSMRQHLQNLRIVGRQLEESGVLNESLRSRSNSWGLHMPLICPDGAVVAYAWKRQLAGQAGASAVDRTRLALKAFTDQKRRFFPHLDDSVNVESPGAEPVYKRHCGSQQSEQNHPEDHVDCKTLSDIFKHLETKIPNMKFFTYQRLDWLKRASSLLSKESSMESTDGTTYCSSNLRPGSPDAVPADKVSVVEILIPSVFRAVISLHPAGSIDPDAVAFFSPDEGGSYIHARGYSVFHVFRHITENAAMALQYFLGIRPESALHSLLLWSCSYQNIFTKVCSKCGQLLSMDRQSTLLLPPVHRPYRHFSGPIVSSQSKVSAKEDMSLAYHVGCYTEES